MLRKLGLGRKAEEMKNTSIQDVQDSTVSVDKPVEMGETPATEITVEEAQRLLDEAQARVSKIKSEEDAKVNDARRIEMEKQADIELAKKQKIVYEDVCGTLKKFKSTPMGKDMPDETALPLALIMEAAMDEYGWRDAMTPVDYSSTSNGIYLRKVSGDELAKGFARIMPKLTSYYAYRKRIGK